MKLHGTSPWCLSNGNFYQGTGDIVLAVYDPSLGFVAGGGRLIHNGFNATVGVNIKYLKNGNAQGSLLYIEHRPGGDVKVKSNSIGTMAIVGGDAIPTGKATVNGGGNYGFISRIIDNGEPGTNDQFGLRVTDSAGNIVVDLTFNPITLSGGTFSVPKLTGAARSANKHVAHHGRRGGPPLQLLRTARV